MAMTGTVVHYLRKSVTNKIYWNANYKQVVLVLLIINQTSIHLIFNRKPISHHLL